jgi:hypothetical protein
VIGKKVPIDQKKARGRTKLSQICALTDYIMAGDEKAGEKVLHAGSRGFTARSFAGQQAEMVAIAMESVRSANPVTHWVLSWREGEVPTQEQVERAIDLFLLEQGLSGHQVMYGVHQDTDNVHLHIVVNRVHPVGLRVAKPNGGFDREATARAIAMIESEQGWLSERRARYRVRDGALMRVLDSGRVIPAGQSWVVADEQKVRHMEERKALARGLVGQPQAEQKAKRAALRVTQAAERTALLKDTPRAPLDSDKRPTLNSRARDMEQRTAESSAQRYAIRTACELFAVAKSWSWLHWALADAGMRYVPKGSGALVYVGEVPLKASQVSRAASLKRMEKRLGPFEPAGPEAVVRKVEPEPLDRSEEWGEYRVARRQYEAARRKEAEALRRRLSDEWQGAKDRQRERRQKLMNQDWQGVGLLRSAVASVLAAEQACERAALKDRHADARAALRRQLPPFPGIEDWLQQSTTPELAGLWRHRHNRAPMLFGDRDDPPAARVRDIRDFIAEPGERCVAYRRPDADAPSFIDYGRRIELQDVPGDDAVLAALQLAAAKWGRVHVSGPADFQAQVIRLAAEHGFAVTNPELQERLATERRHRSPSSRSESTVLAVPSETIDLWELAKREIERAGATQGFGMVGALRLIEQRERWFPQFQMIVAAMDIGADEVVRMFVQGLVEKEVEAEAGADQRKGITPEPDGDDAEYPTP